MASRVADHWLKCVGSVVTAHGLLGPGIEPLSLALAGRCLTTRPPAKPHLFCILIPLSPHICAYLLVWEYTCLLTIWVTPEHTAGTTRYSPSDWWLLKELRPSRGGHGEGDGIPLQYSCLENSMDGGAWWAAVHGVAKD